MADANDIDDFEEEVSRDEVASAPGEAADPQWLVDAKIPADLRKKFEVYSYRSAATILAESHPEEFGELCQALRDFAITRTVIRTAGGNESDVPKLLSASLRPSGWRETIIRGDLIVEKHSKEQIGLTAKGKAKFKKHVDRIRRAKYLDGHKVDYVKGRVAFDLEWNSKDQTFDRDLYAFSAFAQTGVIDVGVLVTRGGAEMTEFIKGLGQALKKNGQPDFTDAGNPRMVAAKYGASTTWMGKLLYRLNAGRNGACPVLVFGITPRCVVDEPPGSSWFVQMRLDKTSRTKHEP